MRCKTISGVSAGKSMENVEVERAIIVKQPSIILRCLLFAMISLVGCLSPDDASANQYIVQGHHYVCQDWVRQKTKPSTHMNLRELDGLPQGLPLDTPIFRNEDGTWLNMELGYYSDFLFEALTGLGPSRPKAAPFFLEAEASRTKDGYKEFFEEAIRAWRDKESNSLPFGALGLPRTITDTHKISEYVKKRARTRVPGSRNYAFWYPSGRYVERGIYLFNSFPCEAGRPIQPFDASEEYAISFNIRQGFVPFHQDSDYRLFIENIEKWIKDMKLEIMLSNAYPFTRNLDESIPYEIYHADEEFVARFGCRRLESQNIAPPPSCDGIVFWPEEGLAISMRFPSQKGVMNGEPLYLEPIRATYGLIQRWKSAGESND